ncbi:MAG: phosphatidate cytidylyltransferase [Gemmataceae bacterium]
MLRTRIWMGAVLIGLTVGVLWIDHRLTPWYPFLLALVLGLALAGCRELRELLAPSLRPAAWLCYVGVTLIVLANWLPHVLGDGDDGGTAWPWIAGALAAFVMLVFLVEMASFEQPGGSTPRLAVAVWMIGYLGLLPSFLAQLRWLGDGTETTASTRGTLALALVIFVPKMGDTFAYFTGRFLGRHPLTPRLSPKKTWEGAAGGLTAAVVTTLVIRQFGPILPQVWSALGFGLTVGLAGMFGDLAESLIKRDCQKKDASQVVPGFGGILDVVDSILFAAPVAYWWLA